MTSPMKQHTRSTSTSLSMKKPQTKAAAQRLAEVMAHQPADDEEEEDELYDFNSGVPSAGLGLAGGRQARNRSPMVRILHTCLHISISSTILDQCIYSIISSISLK